jgi:phage terminase large subunit-like protein
MANTRWYDQHQPQTLYMANILLYINAAFWLLDLLLGAPLLGVFAVAAIFAGLGIANEKRAGYWGGIVVAGLDVLWLLDLFFAAPSSISIIINLVFAGVLLALLLHPMSRSYQKIWFRKLKVR